MEKSAKATVLIKKTSKHASFVSEPIGIKRVTEIPGIGVDDGDLLEELGYDYVNSKNFKD